MTFDRENTEGPIHGAEQAEHDNMALAERIFILHEAGKELAEAYMDGQEEDAAPPPRLDDAVRYTTNLLYRTGAVVSHIDDVAEIIKADIKARQVNKGDDSWVPELEDEDMITDLFLTGTLLSASDNTPAFRANPNGRSFEILDGLDSQYNKYGRLIRPTVSQS
jgi:hypothetical protein